jgi:chemotaxis family two-component system response regulator Rcp1
MLLTTIPFSQALEGVCRMPAVNREPLVDILLVEDSPDDADLMVEALKEGMLAHRVTLIEDGEQAIDHLRRSPTPDLILLDLHLPRRNGHEVLEEIMNDPRLRRIPVVIMTSSDNETAILKVYELHANCYVSKPIDQEQFAQAVKRIKLFWLTVARRERRDEP